MIFRTVSEFALGTLTTSVVVVRSAWLSIPFMLIRVQLQRFARKIQRWVKARVGVVIIVIVVINILWLTALFFILIWDTCSATFVTLSNLGDLLFELRIVRREFHARSEVCPWRVR